MILHAGPIRLWYDRGFLRYLCYGNAEILRMIYFALRDENWTTYKPIIENEKLDVQSDHFNIHYDCYHEADGQRNFHWQVNIQGQTDGSISFEIQGKALAEVIRNRAGFCILHPIDGLAGEPCTTFHPEGKVEHNVFPLHIEPTDPFKLMEGMQWNIDGYTYTLKFEGDLFETEDQRNWMDASYKTFCTPLSIPFPVTLKAGNTVHQKVFFKPLNQLEVIPDPVNEIIISSSYEPVYSPKIGLDGSTDVQLLNEKSIEHLKNLFLDHIRVDINLENSDWKLSAANAYQTAEIINSGIYVALHLTHDFQKQIEGFTSWSQEQPIQPAYLLLLNDGKKVTSTEVLNEVQKVKTFFPTSRIGASTNFGFTEINRNRFDSTDLDFIAFSANPQMHASDDLTIIENIATQEEMMHSAKLYYGESKGVHISPLTWKMRLNPAATNPKKKSTGSENPDVRFYSPIAAAFTLGSLNALSKGGCKAVTLFQTAGNQGILSPEGDPYPIYQALELWNKISGHLVHTSSTHPLLVEAILSTNETLKSLVLINHTSKNQKVVFEGKEYEVDSHEIKLHKI